VPIAIVSPKSPEESLADVYRYHDGTKHHFNRFAPSLGYLDWASQPDPFRRFDGADVLPLYPAPDAASGGYVADRATFDQACELAIAAQPMSTAAIGDMLRHALGLSAWKRYETSRWALRVNPSSGNLHPTEAYVITEASLYHYAPDRHILERRCAFDNAAWEQTFDGRRDVVLVALTSIHWREAWKYGERAFRYCQHDLGHAIAAVSIAAGLLGWRAVLLPAWSTREIAAVTGIDRPQDFVDAEREEAGCIMALAGGGPVECASGAAQHLIEAVQRGRWSGRANQLSKARVEWPIIDDVARATEDPRRTNVSAPAAHDQETSPDRGIDARSLLLRRRSALAFDGRTAIDRATFVDMLSRLMPRASAPWLTSWWSPRVHLAMFVHRVDDVPPGLYVLLRDPDVSDRLRAECRPDVLWEAADDRLPFWCLARGDARAIAARLSCDQDIAADGFFSLGMIADFDASLQTLGPSFYRHLFWETGMVGQVLYLEAEAAGARATGIGCFYDDPVHELLGLRGHSFQSLYHFTVGSPVEDARLTTEPGYTWERLARDPGGSERQ
jgi:SagB-type dehydrogenase family enzyme